MARRGKYDAPLHGSSVRRASGPLSILPARFACFKHTGVRL